MKTNLFFRQNKPLTVIILGLSLVLLAAVITLEDATRLEPIITMLCIGTILLGYSISYEMNANFNHKKHFKLFGITMFKIKLDCFVPEYVTLFSTATAMSSEWGPVSAMGKELKEQNFVVRLFKGSQYFTVYRTKSYSKGRLKAINLGDLLKIEVRL